MHERRDTDEAPVPPVPNQARIVECRPLATAACGSAATNVDHQWLRAVISGSFCLLPVDSRVGQLPVGSAEAAKHA